VVLVEVDEDTTAYHKGHIKGAVTLDWKQDLQDPVRRDFTGRAGFEALLIGERSAHTWFVLHELLSRPNVKNYDGSWTEYGSMMGVPIETGN